MTHPMLKYWRQAFHKYQVGPDQFYSDQMSDPILSPNFITEKPSQSQLRTLKHLNIISKNYQLEPPLYDGFALRNHHFLCQMNLKPQILDSSMTIEPLEICAKKESHQNLLKDAFPNDFAFLKLLEGFLPSLEAKYYD